MSLEQVDGATATERHVLIGPQDGAPDFVMRRFVMGEGGGMPLHRTVLFIPAGAPHSYHVVKAPFEFLCMVPQRQDRIELC